MNVLSHGTLSAQEPPFSFHLQEIITYNHPQLHPLLLCVLTLPVASMHLGCRSSSPTGYSFPATHSALTHTRRKLTLHEF